MKCPFKIKKIVNVALICCVFQCIELRVSFNGECKVAAVTRLPVFFFFSVLGCNIFLSMLCSLFFEKQNQPHKNKQKEQCQLWSYKNSKIIITVVVCKTRCLVLWVRLSPFLFWTKPRASWSLCCMHQFLCFLVIRNIDTGLWLLPWPWMYVNCLILIFLFHSLFY